MRSKIPTTQTIPDYLSLSQTTSALPKPPPGVGEARGRGPGTKATGRWVGEAGEGVPGYWDQGAGKGRSGGGGLGAGGREEGLGR